MKSQSPDKRVTRVALVALIGTVIGAGVPGCKDPKSAGAYYNQGVARLEKGEHDAAISDLTKAIKMRPRSAMALAVAYSERAVIHFIRKEYDKIWENIHKMESLGLQARPGFLKALREASGRRK